VKTQAELTVSEYTYDALGRRVGWHYDTDVDGDVDGSDKWY
jgi:YD repeat-containing protein